MIFKKNNLKMFLVVVFLCMGSISWTDHIILFLASIDERSPRPAQQDNSTWPQPFNTAIPTSRPSPAILNWSQTVSKFSKTTMATGDLVGDNIISYFSRTVTTAAPAPASMKMLSRRSWSCSCCVSAVTLLKTRTRRREGRKSKRVIYPRWPRDVDEEDNEALASRRSSPSTSYSGTRTGTATIGTAAVIPGREQELQRLVLR
ncbi:unnamed protein product [Amoebophrya sp. A120]|nr:unnamed protein product [Amoebophrya sp. A120]|eukprot:GSA120T00016399001.1